MDVAQGPPLSLGEGAARTSFTVAYAVLFAYTVVTAIEALGTKQAHARHVMNLETAVSLVATMFYASFVRQAAAPGFRPEQVMPYRYLDWSITTPCLLAGLALFVEGGPVAWRPLAGVLALDGAMLALGYLGESGRLPRAAYNAGFDRGMLAREGCALPIEWRCAAERAKQALGAFVKLQTAHRWAFGERGVAWHGALADARAAGELWAWMQAHDLAAARPRCGAPTKGAGGACRRAVKDAGARCWQH